MPQFLPVKTLKSFVGQEKLVDSHFEQRLLVFESPRRFRRYGYPRILLEWAVNWFWVLIFGKARSKDWEAVR